MFCPNCASQNNDDTEICVNCGSNLKNPIQILEKNEQISLSSVVPVGRTGLSIVAGYLGLCAIIPILAPFSLIVSIIALQKLKNSPRKLGKDRAIFGLIMGILGTAALIYLLLAKGKIMY